MPQVDTRTNKVHKKQHRGTGKNNPKREAHLPRKTHDPEFNLKVEECRMVESNIGNIQRMFRNFYRSTGGKYNYNHIKTKIKAFLIF